MLPWDVPPSENCSILFYPPVITSQIFGKCFPIFFVAVCLFYIITWSMVFPVILHETSFCHPCVAHVSLSDQRFL